ncbi:WD repeat- and FYVE domain-containing protein 4 isoform X2 [Engraulis encrasicolus]|uniref:WD repeat- and FYVE domain-containing protein 4 isoform X2 n=1 Tax=Engraulis encrasicolus TaxID=184585 RepID=UPI002FD3C6A0
MHRVNKETGELSASGEEHRGRPVSSRPVNIHPHGRSPNRTHTHSASPTHTLTPSLARFPTPSHTLSSSPTSSHSFARSPTPTQHILAQHSPTAFAGSPTPTSSTLSRSPTRPLTRSPSSHTFGPSPTRSLSISPSRSMSHSPTRTLGPLVQMVREGVAKLERKSSLPVEEGDVLFIHLLPRFIQVSESSNGVDDVDLKTLASLVCTSLVTNIQDRIDQRPADEARRELSQFFRRSATEDAIGWLLLKAFSLLSARQTAVMAAVKSGLPGALVRCLYVFVATEEQDEDEDNDEAFRLLLIQVMVQQCRQVCFVEEMLETQELVCILVAMTSLWDQCSQAWRQQASRVLRAVSAAQARNTIPVLQGKDCMRLCIQNLRTLCGPPPTALTHSPPPQPKNTHTHATGAAPTPESKHTHTHTRSTPTPIPDPKHTHAHTTAGPRAPEHAHTHPRISTQAQRSSPTKGLTRTHSRSSSPTKGFTHAHTPGRTQTHSSSSPTKGLTHTHSHSHSHSPGCAAGHAHLQARSGPVPASIGPALLLSGVEPAESLLACAAHSECVTGCVSGLAPCVCVPGLVLAEVAVCVFSFVKDSYQISPALFQEFEDNDGYTLLQAILERCEEEVCIDSFQPVEDLLGLVSSFTLFGRTQLKVALCITDPQPPGFKFNPCLTKGSTVRNLRAYSVLQSCLVRSASPLLVAQVYHSVSTVWSWEKANFFLLEWSTGALAQMAQLAWRKPPHTYELFCELLETVVLSLDYIPHEALRHLQAVFKQNPSETFNAVVLLSLHKMALRSGLLAEVLSDNGMMELLLLELRKHAKILRKQGLTGNEQHLDLSERLLTIGMLKLVAALAMRSIRNTVCIRDRGMLPYIKVFLDDDEFRVPALSILEQLAEINPDDYMSSTIGALCSSTHTEHTLKLHLLQSLLRVLENPSSWPAFRMGGGFEGLLSIIGDMDGALANPPAGVWAAIGRQAASELLLLALHTMASAVHLDPISGHVLEREGYYTRLGNALLHLGCFQDPPPMPTHIHNHSHTHAGHSYAYAHSSSSHAHTHAHSLYTHTHTSNWRSFRQFAVLLEADVPPLPPALLECVRLLGYLDQFATGSLEPPEVTMEVDMAAAAAAAGSHMGFTCEQTILHPAAIRLMIILLPRIYDRTDPQLSMEVQYAVADHVQVLLRSERNRQIMCEGDLLSTLLTHTHTLLLTHTHPLHLPVTRILEKLASQSISPANLRRFLCLGSPFQSDSSRSCPAIANGNHNGGNADEPSSDEDEGVCKSVRKMRRGFSMLGHTPSTPGPALPLHQVISLVSMTAPRSFRPHSLSATPPFVEFDMSESGYGCLFLPSLATVKGVNSDGISTGGVGRDCRGFPPVSGLSFSCWFMMSRFSGACDNHPLRLLTIIRHMSRSPQQYACLSLYITSDGCLVISTEEEPYQDLDGMEPEEGSPSPLPSTCRFKCAQQLSPAQWHHLTLVLAKDIKRSCKVTAYLNAKVIGSSKMQYIRPFPGTCMSMEPCAVVDVCGIMGTPSLWKQHAALVWRLGPSFLWEEPLGPAAVESVYNHGTCYLGNFLNTQEGSRLVPEERVSFGINVAVSTLTTVADIREVYNEVDSRLIAKEMGITSRDNTTPVLLCRNISQHLPGTSRTIGAALVGMFGVRVFSPSSASRSFQFIGGPAAILSLVAMATDDSCLYAALKVCVSVLNTNPCMEKEMQRIQGYKLLAFLLKMKAGLISSRTFQLVLSLCGTAELGTGPLHALTHHTHAFRDLLCDNEIWQKAPENLDLSVIKHFSDILKTSSDEGRVASVLYELGLVCKLLFQLHEPLCPGHKITHITGLLTLLLQRHLTQLDTSRVGLFVISTLPPPSLDENSLFPAMDFDEQGLSQSPLRMVCVRNRLLEMFIDLLKPDSTLSTESQLQVFEVLGFDWFLMLLQSHLHKSSVLLGLKLLSLLLSLTHTHTPLLSRLRDTHTPGTLLQHAVHPTDGLDTLRSQVWSRGSLSASCGGLVVLQRLLEGLVHLPHIYTTLASLFLNINAPHTPAEQVDLDNVLQSLLESSSTHTSQTYSVDSASTDTVHSDSSHNTVLTHSSPSHTPRGINTPTYTPPPPQPLPAPLCVEAACMLVDLVRVIITQRLQTGSEVSSDIGSDMHLAIGSDMMSEEGSEGWQVCYPGSVMQFLCLVHSLRPQDPLWTRPHFLSALARAMFPTYIEGDDEGTAPHPARKQVMDFSRLLLLDSLMHMPANHTHTHHPLEQLLEFSPDGECEEQRQRFQTELLMSVMELIHITGQEDTHLARDDGNITECVLQDNVAFFCVLLVEKLYMGLFHTHPDTLLPFIAEQILAVAKEAHSQRERVMSALYKSLNRALLYFLCGPRVTSCDKRLVLQTLATLETQWDVVMATYNNNVRFTSCLLHCLLLVRSGSYPEGFGCEGFRRPRPLVSEEEDGLLGTGTSVKSELMSAVERVWGRVLQERRVSLEEAFKVDLSAKGGRDEPVPMADVTPLFEEHAQKAWTAFIEAQKKRLDGVPSRKSVLDAVRSVYRRPGKPSGTVEEFLDGMELFRKTAQEMFDSLLSNHTQCQQWQLERVCVQWQQQEAELLRERGVFGPAPGVMLQQDWWIQDATEGPARTRARVRRQALRRSRKVQVLTSGLCVKSNPVEETRGMTEHWGADAEMRILCEAGCEAGEEAGSGSDQLTFFPELSEPITHADTHTCSETHIILQELREGEEVKAKMSVIMVSGYVLNECVLLFGRADLYVCEGFNLTPSGDVCCTTHHPCSIRDAFLSNMFKRDKSDAQSCKRWPYDDIKDAHFMRFLLEDNALEIFLRNGSSVFLVFPNKEHVSAYKRLSAVAPALKGRGMEAVFNTRRTGGVDKNVLFRWQRGEMSNFEYLMHLNTLAGRTYNDLMQYPIFPWVLANYTSETLDLSCPESFRDLSKPMGAQTAQRRDNFIQRYNELESSENDGDLSVRCHYCTHYSSAIIVASFLVRMEPFSHTFLALQGGSFDVPERMFHCIQREWESASRDNMSDVRELIPEFYYLPDFLTNTNNLHFGCMQDGTSLDDVVLPPWAKGDPQEFIRMHREALESDYVSSHLHLWVDLMFGYRQQGAPAVEAVNVFHPYFYAHSLDQSHLTNPRQRDIILGYINNFGQVPKQLFTRPHPCRFPHKKDPSPNASHVMMPFYLQLDKLKPSATPIKELQQGPVGQVVCVDREVFAMEGSRLLIPPLAQFYFSWGCYDNSCCFGTYSTDKVFAVCESVCEWGQVLCAACPNSNTIVTGSSSSVVCVWDIQLKDKHTQMTLKQPLYGHTAAVSCVCVSESWGLIVSGSHDQTCILWDLEELSYVTQLPSHTHAVSAVSINRHTGEIVSCAGPQLYLWSVRGQLLTSLDTGVGPEGWSICCLFTQRNQWDATNAIVTGGNDGIIRIWRTEYSRSQLPTTLEGSSDQQEPQEGLQEAEEVNVSWERHLVLCRELNRSQQVSRRRYRSNPAVTALTVSRSNGTLLSGDAWGRVFCWSSET